MGKRFWSGFMGLFVFIMVIGQFDIVWGKVLWTEEAREVTKEPSELYAKSAVLMDAASGRILFEKNGEEILPMASTTKIMTCILVLEHTNPEETVMVSSYAASMPDVQLNIKEKEVYYIKDLLHSLMLESHNDTAVALAEHVGRKVSGDLGENPPTMEESKQYVRAFGGLMNKKAKELGCSSTHFVTPNGLDGADEAGIHATTAAELARIMSYCILESPKKTAFLQVTRTAVYSFSDVEGKRSFSCTNHNAFLQMMDGAISGKTGFTNQAGYCYVGALEREGRVFTVALLACGWPNHKTYKWSDTRKLMEYGIANYFEKEVWMEPNLSSIPVKNGIQEMVGTKLEITEEEKEVKLLLKEGETITSSLFLEKELEAPVEQGQKVGTYSLELDGNIIKTCPVIAQEKVGKITFFWCLRQVLDQLVL